MSLDYGFFFFNKKELEVPKRKLSKSIFAVCIYIYIYTLVEHAKFNENGSTVFFENVTESLCSKYLRLSQRSSCIYLFDLHSHGNKWLYGLLGIFCEIQ